LRQFTGSRHHLCRRVGGSTGHSGHAVPKWDKTVELLLRITVCNSESYVVLQCVAVCCSVLQCVAVCFAAVCCSGVLQCVAVSLAVCSSVLQCVAVCGRVSQYFAVGCSELRSVLQRVAVHLLYYYLLHIAMHINNMYVCVT